MGYEPPQPKSEWLTPPPRIQSFPPRKPRWPGPRRTCERCGMVSETSDPRCPVCGARFARNGMRGAMDRLFQRT